MQARYKVQKAHHQSKRTEQYLFLQAIFENAFYLQCLF